MKEEMIEHTINGIAELVYEDEIKEAEASLEYYANQRVIEELESIKNQCRFYSDRLIGGQAYGFNEINSIVTKRIKELKQD